MFRKLIALLVLVTGLAAVAQPANALNIRVEPAGLASLESQFACAGQPGQAVGKPAPLVQREGSQPKICPRPAKVVLIVPTVMLQADRARE